MFEWDKDRRMVLRETAPGVTVDNVRANTEAEFIVDPKCKEYDIKI